MFGREEIVEMRLAQTRNAPGTAYSGLEPPVQPGAGDETVQQHIDRVGLHGERGRAPFAESVGARPVRGGTDPAEIVVEPLELNVRWFVSAYSPPPPMTNPAFT